MITSVLSIQVTIAASKQWYNTSIELPTPPLCISRGARPLFFDKPATGCCKRLCMFIHSNNTPGSLLGWTTLQIFYWMSGILTFVALPQVGVKHIRKIWIIHTNSICHCYFPVHNSSKTFTVWIVQILYIPNLISKCICHVLLFLGDYGNSVPIYSINLFSFLIKFNWNVFLCNTVITIDSIWLA